LDHRVGWVERSETQHFVFVGFRSSTQPTFHALAEIMIKGDFLVLIILSTTYWVGAGQTMIKIE
jgi:hypothetical protein